MTSATVIDSALNVYQTALRKPSWTIWVVDYPVRCLERARTAWSKA